MKIYTPYLQLFPVKINTATNMLVHAAQNVNADL
jgi:hypothetical protein